MGCVADRHRRARFRTSPTAQSFHGGQRGTGPIAPLRSWKRLGGKGGRQLDLGEDGFEGENPRRQRVVIGFDGAFQKAGEAIYGIAAVADKLAESGALPYRRPRLEPEDDKRCRAEDDPERHPSQLSLGVGIRASCSFGNSRSSAIAHRSPRA